MRNTRQPTFRTKRQRRGFMNIDSNFEFTTEFKLDDYILEIKDDYFGTLLLGTDYEEFEQRDDFKTVFENDDVIACEADLEKYDEESDFDKLNIFFDQDDETLIEVAGRINFDLKDGEEALRCFYELYDELETRTDISAEMEVDSLDEEEYEEEEYPGELERGNLSIEAVWETPNLIMCLSVERDEEEDKLTVMLSVSVNPMCNNNYFAVDDVNFDLLAKYVSEDISLFDSAEAILEATGEKDYPIVREKAPFGLNFTTVDFTDDASLRFVTFLKKDEEKEEEYIDKYYDFLSLLENDVYDSEAMLIMDEDDCKAEEMPLCIMHSFDGFATSATVSLTKSDEYYVLDVEITPEYRLIPCMMAENDKGSVSEDMLEFAYETLGLEVGTDMDTVEETYTSLINDLDEDLEKLDSLPEEEKEKITEKKYELDEAFSIISEYFLENDALEFTEEEISEALDTLGLKEGAGLQEVYDAYSSFMDRFVKIEEPTEEEIEKKEAVADALELLIDYFEYMDAADDDFEAELTEEEEVEALETLGLEKGEELTKEKLDEAFLEAVEDADTYSEVIDIDEAYAMLAHAYDYEMLDSPFSDTPELYELFNLEDESLDTGLLKENYEKLKEGLEDEEEKEELKKKYKKLKRYMKLILED